MTKKKDLGQFFTRNSDYVIDDLLSDFLDIKLWPSCSIVDPFAGDCDLLDRFYITQLSELDNRDFSFSNKIFAYDIDPQDNPNIKFCGGGFVKKRDSLINPVSYKNMWIITNPPWLAKNKTKEGNNKKIFDKYNTNDLYKCALRSFVESSALGGTIIIPLNFWCEEQRSLRKIFLSRYRVSKVKVFEEQIFQDTTYTACAFNFIRKDLVDGVADDEQEVCFEFWRGSKFECLDGESLFVKGSSAPYKSCKWNLHSSSDYRIGKDYIEMVNRYKRSSYEVGRFTNQDSDIYNNLVLCAQDTGTESGMIRMEVRKNTHVDNTPNLTDRVLAGIKITKEGNRVPLTKEQQQKICDLFNETLNKFRERYHSMCLTNYRNSTSTLARKRISFDAAYSIVKYCCERIL